MLKKIVIILLGFSVIFVAMAENARVGALGGCDQSGDISSSLENPVSINDFPDVIQGTMNVGESDGSLVGVKSLSSKFNVGFWIPNSDENIISSDFFTDAKYYINGAGTFNSTALSTSNFVRIPKLLLGLSVSDNVGLGATIFYETARFSSDSANSTLNPKSEITEEQSISNMGIIVDANLVIGSVAIIPTLGAYKPSLKGSYETTGASNTKLELSTSSYAFKAGLEADIEFGDNTFISGLNWTQENYQFRYSDATQNSHSDRSVNSYINPYLTYVANLAGNVTVISCYGLSVDITRTKVEQATAGYNETNIDYGHEFVISVERSTYGFFIFDEFTPRMSVLYTFDDSNNNTSSSSGPNITTNTHNQSTSGYGAVTAGFGISRGLGTLDINANIASWDGAISGPSLVNATLTVDFKKIRKS